MNDLQQNEFIIAFIGIGTGKAATSWINTCLSQHPTICMSTPKETNFFLNENYSKGIGWYRSHFKDHRGEKIFGEYSPSYFSKEYVPGRIHSHFPHAKLIVSLRDPIERFISSRQYKVAMGRHTDSTINEETLITYKDDLDEGFYAKHLKNYLRYFPKEQMIIVFYEDIQKDPLAVIQKIYAFLGIDSAFIPPSLRQKVNVTGLNTTKFPFVHRISGAWYKKFTRSKYRNSLLPVLKALGIHQLFYSIRKANIENTEKVIPMPQNITPVALEQLRTYYKNDVQKLSKLCERDLSSWYTGK